VAVLDLTGYSLNIINYWAVTNSLYIDFISRADFSPTCNVLVTDRLGNANDAFSTASYCYLTAPTFNYFNGVGPCSVTMWLYMISASQRGIFDFSYNYWDDIIISSSSSTFCSSGVNFGWTIYQYYTPYSLCTTPNLAAGVWTHVAVTFTSGTQCVYLNGAGSCSSTGANMNSYARNYNYIGYNTWGQYGDFLMDEIKFHSRVLSSTEINNDMNYGKSYISFV
jgi:hypothetical protein